MKRVSIIVFSLLTTLSAAAIPVNPRWLQRLESAGDTASIRKLMQVQADEPMVQSAQAVRRISQLRQTAMPLNIAKRGLIILVNFKDLSYQAENTQAEMDSMITGLNYTRSYTYTYGGKKYTVTSQGSVRQYFEDASNGAYNPQFDVVGPVTVDSGYAYYGQNLYGRSGYDAHPAKMVYEACKLVDKLGVDFSQYDNDKDGAVDYVYVFYAGKNESDGAGDNYIWPHSSTLSRENLRLNLDGKQISKYACGGEISDESGKHDGIGTFCHEFSHVLGLPDLYETTNSGTWKTLGTWDIMDAGCYNNDGNTPPTFSAYERWYMGWMQPEICNSIGSDTLQELQSSNHSYIVTETGSYSGSGNDPNPTTFYLLENRQQTGWDQYLPGHGMMLTKVQYDYDNWSNDVVNNTEDDMGVDLIEADGKAPSAGSTGYYGKETDLYPAGEDYYLGITDYPISGIKEENGVITFNMKDSTFKPTVDCNEYSWTATEALDSGINTLNGMIWVEGGSGITNDYHTNSGASFGKATQVSLYTDALSECVPTYLIVTARGNNATLSVSMGGQELGSKTLTARSSSYTFYNTQELSGRVVIYIDQTEATTKQILYLKAIQVSYDEPTGVEEMSERDERAQKVLWNGRIYIQRDGKIYNIDGTRIL